MSTRPDFATLADWVEGRLPTAEAERVAEAVRLGDEDIRSTVAWLRGFLAAAGVLPLHEPPPSVRENLTEAFARWRVSEELPHQRSATERAELSFDSRRDLAPAGIRSATALEDTIHLAYTGESADLVLDVRRTAADRVSLDGQVLPIGPAPASGFTATVAGFSTVETDELGRFQLAELPKQAFELQVSDGESTLVAAIDLTGES